jgi:hypothetical protein
VAHVASAPSFTPAATKRVRLRDRMLDIVAAACIIGGSTMFLLARRTLTTIGDGGLVLPYGSPVTNVAFTDSVVLRTRFGIWLVVVGALIAVASAISHRFRKGA